MDRLTTSLGPLERFTFKWSVILFASSLSCRVLFVLSAVLLSFFSLSPMPRSHVDGSLAPSWLSSLGTCRKRDAQRGEEAFFFYAKAQPRLRQYSALLAADSSSCASLYPDAGHHSRSFRGRLLAPLSSDTGSSRPYGQFRHRSPRPEAIQLTHRSARFFFRIISIAPFQSRCSSRSPSAPVPVDHEGCVKIGDFGLAATDFAPNDTALDHTPLKAISDAADLTSGAYSLPTWF